jgi:hypothetical protein
LSAAELVRGQKSSTLDSFLNEIKKSSILTKQQFVYKNIEVSKPFTKERLAERFIAQNMQLFKNEKWNKLNMNLLNFKRGEIDFKKCLSFILAFRQYTNIH